MKKDRTCTTKDIKILGIIPVRAGSKRVPGKNIKMIAGKPLMYWTIEAAKKSKLLTNFVVSTEDTTIAKIAMEQDVEVIARPDDLATDETPLLDVIQHVLCIEPADVVVILHATSPIRNPGRIDECIKQYLDSKVDTVVTGFNCKYKEYSADAKPNSQDVKGFFFDDGNVYVIDANLVKDGSLYSNNYGKVFTSREENVDIDEPFDFWLAEKILEERKNVRGNG